MVRCALVLFTLVLTTTFSLAQDIETGPKKGIKTPALKVQAVTGPVEGKVDYAGKRKERPTVYVFIQAHKWSRPMHRFLKSLGESLPKKNSEAFVVAVWLTENQKKTKNYLPKISQYYLTTALTYYPGEKAGPLDWNVNDQADVTVVVANQGKVSSSLGYSSINETAVKEILAKVKKGN